MLMMAGIARLLVGSLWVPRTPSMGHKLDLDAEL
jgi:hypothetical protein